MYAFGQHVRGHLLLKPFTDRKKVELIFRYKDRRDESCFVVAQCKANRILNAVHRAQMRFDVEEFDSVARDLYLGIQPTLADI